MKKIICILSFLALAISAVRAQATCKCDQVKFSISNWICKGKDAAGNPVYSGTLTVKNSSACKFVLTEIMQQTGGDVVMTLPWSVAPSSTASTGIVYTDHPPFATVGSTPYFIVVYYVYKEKCKFEFASAKIPKCPGSECACNDAGWQPFTAQVNNNTKTVNCGFQFSVTCGEKIMLNGGFKCKGDCKATYTAVLKNTVTNVVVQTYPAFTFPWSISFPAPGNFSLLITPVCGHDKCQPCRFFFTVKDCKTSCDCNPDGWQTFVASTSSGVQKVNCGFQFGLKINAPIKLDGKYTCRGDCTVKYTGVLKNNVSGAVIQTFNPLNFPWTHNFPAGNFKLEITPVCGDRKCQPCVFFFTVR